ncbi:hemerythrin domain-containing protein [Simiduia curdlanivorans]|uniref:Hemerythrin domain-containing protein n=1 Tax=Simiduia curdlanivorans TaxID=1492769 RepID=A0ABV8V716_9GAMM|nr:hemerythrin domain-containing protein [Simiduia curdlanivorans]MDN3638639.1 hemerythrin domain-containing protein [Simiduia curdlanivorans]
MSRCLAVTDFFVRDHDRLDCLLEAAYYADDVDHSRALFAAFRFGLERHMAWEEQLLFPLFEQKTGWVDVGPTVGMVAEHQQIRLLLALMAQYDFPVHAPEAKKLQSILACHNNREERIVYPGIDDDCTEVEIKTLLAELYDNLAQADDLYLVM